MARRGRFDDWIDDDSDETGATVIMDGSVDFDTVADGLIRRDDDDDDEGETVVMKASDAAAMFDDDAVLDEAFQPWVEEEETRVERYSADVREQTERGGGRKGDRAKRHHALQGCPHPASPPRPSEAPTVPILHKSCGKDTSGCADTG